MTDNLSLMTHNPSTAFRADNRNSFTLIELLVVLALVAILSVVVVMTLNPAELIKQARDSNRLSDLSTINTALNLFSADVTSGFMGTSTVIYVSIPDNTSSTCGSLGLPTLPSGWNYNCVTTANLRNTNGTGWIPVNFQRISSNSPISQLPIDPQNTTSTKYYTYVTGGSWKVMATPESEKYTATAGIDGGTNIGQFEVGNNMSLAPFIDGLVGWWKFDEGSGMTATDSSGWGNGISLFDSPSWIPGRVGSFSLGLNGSTNYGTASGLSSVSTSINSKTTFSAWLYWDGLGSPVVPFKWGGNWYSLAYWGGLGFTTGNSDTYGTNNSPSSIWIHVVAIFNNGDYTQNSIFIDGIQQSLYQIRGVIAPQYSYASSTFSIGSANPSYNFGSKMDDARIYNRALSAAEVSALYNATR